MALSPLLQAITDVVHEKFVNMPAKLELTEEADGNKCPPVLIKKSGPALVLKFDKDDSNSKALFPLFRDALDLKKTCDYVIFYEPPDKPPTVYALLCELKSSNSGGMKSKSKNQVENTKILAEYIVEMAAHHALKQARPTVNYRGITFVGKGVLEPKGYEKRPLCPYRRHDRWENLGLATLPASIERHISYFCHNAFLVI